MTALDRRPTLGGLVVPYVVDARNDPIKFAVLQPGRVMKCAEQRLCAICGKRIPNGARLAFIGPDDGRRCFADVWMDERCARLSMQQCPFLGGRDFKDQDSREEPLLQPYRTPQVLFFAPNGRAHRDEFGHWHFEALGTLTRA